ncbi:MAG: DUF3261 domain-containing protein [Vibrio sp.]
MKKFEFRSLGLVLFALLLSACAAPQKGKDPSAQNQVEIAPRTWVSMPQPQDLGYTLNTSQLISATYHDEQNQTQQNQLPIQLQVTPNKIVLAGFSSWGTRLLSLTYQNSQIDTDVMMGLANSLPKPEQVLFNLMITLWPIDVWQDRLAPVGWKLTEQSVSGLATANAIPVVKQRKLFSETGELVAEMNFTANEALKGDIEFINHPLDFSIEIKTLQYSTK